jgi:CPA1 family monovalent cation:H+ antiporter
VRVCARALHHEPTSAEDEPHHARRVVQLLGVLAFLANSLVFLLIGLAKPRTSQINVTTLAAAWQPVLAAVVAILVARGVVVYELCWLTRWLHEPIPLRWQHVLNWGGLRGAIGLALALSLPAALGPDRDLLRLMAYGVVLFTLLAQSTTMRPLLRWLKIIGRGPVQVEYELRHARLMAFRAAAMRLDQMHRDGLLSTHTWERLRPQLLARNEVMADAVQELLQANPVLEAEEATNARRELLHAQRAVLLDMRRNEAISEEAYGQLVAEIDATLEQAMTGERSADEARPGSGEAKVTK